METATSVQNCHDGLQESSWVLLRSHLPQYLEWIAEHLDGEFPSVEIARILDGASKLGLKGRKQFAFVVEHGPRRVDLCLTLAVWDRENFLVRFCTQPDLASEIDVTTERYYDEMA